MNRIKRYEWEDALIDAGTAGTISNGALLLALKLARVITWAPKAGKPAGLYWKNEEALKAVGAGRSTYFKHRAELFHAGFFCEEKRNLVICIPESTVETFESQVETAHDDQKSTVETRKSTVETEKSTVETEKSTGDNPYSVDTYSEDVSSEDTYSEETPAAPVDQEEPSTPSSPSLEDTQASLLHLPPSPAGPTQMEELRKSTVETFPLSEVQAYKVAKLINEHPGAEEYMKDEGFYPGRSEYLRAEMAVRRVKQDAKAFEKERGLLSW